MSMRGWSLMVLTLALLGTAAHAQRAASSASGIYTCIDDRGRKITSDRPIPDCNAKEQRVLNSDGSLRTVRPPSMTSDELAEREARERTVMEARAAQNDAARRDRNLLHRYKTEAAHQKAREAALDSVRVAIRVTKARIDVLTTERKPLLDEAEFYKGKPLPYKLKGQFDANDAALEAQRAAANTQASELDRINRLYDAELARLKALWAGATPGSLGALPPAPPPPLRP
jgi:hypothetical protein